MQIRYSLALATLLGAPAFAASVSLSIEVPRLNVAEYHRPYVAAWIERPDHSVASTLAVWYDIKNKGGNPEGEGTKWLKDIRQWWRRTGRELQLPLDGVSSATRPAGKQVITASEGSVQLPKLAPGAYKLFVEAARESGGREIVSIPFQWPPAQAEQPQVSGSSELGEVKLELRP
ncbi:DUF2271 domain-containing protein [Variovorax sp. J22R133]|uniref:DUF2271 domain-containing protein n=1 Tax=Variovorax brevis TaxID=3053503 RepID=UPI00257663D5|nr:DUF2271 domain-containing protein [Variovorax sp. J22R133]MDM0113178.1 DUF2271 domain-containing protein [Variovorax sp. J22R133]